MSLGCADIHRCLVGHEPRVDAMPPGDGRSGRAAVAAVLHEPHPGDARLLFIERCRRDGDPWSGHLAFPGGRLEGGDADERAAAERETREEVDLDLTPARCLGRLDDRPARVQPLTVSAFVYALELSPDPPALRFSDEVTDAFWTPLADLLDPTRHCQHEMRRDGLLRRFPAIDLLGPGRPLLWGVTYGFVHTLLQVAGHDLPTPA
jgi:8-oxo-dGTP pyrophosphatase MutT (NUDIX family)